MFGNGGRRRFRRGAAAFFCTTSDATVEQSLEAFTDRVTLEQNFREQKEA